MSYTWKIVPMSDTCASDPHRLYTYNKGLYYSQADDFISDLAIGAHLIKSPSHVFVANTLGTEGFYKEVKTWELLEAFNHSGDSILYLGGSRPERYLDYWEELLCEMQSGAFFSDFYCKDFDYDIRQLTQLDMYSRGIFRVFLSESICSTNNQHFWHNLDRLVDSGLRLVFEYLDKDKTLQNRVAMRVVQRYPWLIGYFRQFSR